MCKRFEQELLTHCWWEYTFGNPRWNILRQCLLQVILSLLQLFPSSKHPQQKRVHTWTTLFCFSLVVLHHYYLALHFGNSKSLISSKFRYMHIKVWLPKLLSRKSMETAKQCLCPTYIVFPRADGYIESLEGGNEDSRGKGTLIYYLKLSSDALKHFKVNQLKNTQ